VTSSTSGSRPRRRAVPLQVENLEVRELLTTLVGAAFAVPPHHGILRHDSGSQGLAHRGGQLNAGASRASVVQGILDRFEVQASIRGSHAFFHSEGTIDSFERTLYHDLLHRNVDRLEARLFGGKRTFGAAQSIAIAGAQAPSPDPASKASPTDSTTGGQTVTMSNGGYMVGSIMDGSALGQGSAEAGTSQGSSADNAGSPSTNTTDNMAMPATGSSADNAMPAVSSTDNVSSPSGTTTDNAMPATGSSADNTGSDMTMPAAGSSTDNAMPAAGSPSGTTTDNMAMPPAVGSSTDSASNPSGTTNVGSNTDNAGSPSGTTADNMAMPPAGAGTSQGSADNAGSLSTTTTDNMAMPPAVGSSADNGSSPSGTTTDNAMPASSSADNAGSNMAMPAASSTDSGSSPSGTTTDSVAMPPAVGSSTDNASNPSGMGSNDGMMGSSMISGGYINMPDGRIPDFGAHPTTISVKSGLWSDPSTWSLGMVPGTGDVVDVSPGTTVTYDVVSDVHLNTIEVQAGGSLQFKTDVNTRVVVGNFLILPGGELTVGTAANPVAPQVTAEIVIADQSINLALDPEQYGTGLIGLGKVEMYGAQKDAFLRLAQEAKPGDTTLTLAQAPVGWKAGDQIVLPPTTPDPIDLYYKNYVTEELTIASIDGNVVTLTSPLQTPHLAALDGDGQANLSFLPHVGDVSRNVVVRSENPNGTRGHTMFMDTADVTLGYVQFKDLGRTTGDGIDHNNFQTVIDPTGVDNTTFDAQGNVTHIGTNQIGRYALHFHHVKGPVGGTGDGYQFEVVGCAVDGATKWGLVVHDSDYGLIRDNVVYNVQTAGIATEEGSEIGNVFEHNFVTGVARGNGFWLNGTQNYWRDNVAADVHFVPDEIQEGAGFYAAPNLNNTLTFTVPAFAGADESQLGGSTQLLWAGEAFQDFSNNETYSCHHGIYFDHRLGGVFNLNGFRAWSASWYGGTSVQVYSAGSVVCDGLVSRQAEFNAQANWGDIVLQNSDVQGSAVGVRDTASNGFALIVRNTYLRNQVDIATYQPNGGTAGLAPGGYLKHTILDNDRFDAPPGQPLVAVQLNDHALGASRPADAPVPLLPQLFEIRNYQQQPGQDFRLYYPSQKSDYVVPSVADFAADAAAGMLVVAAPEPGLTNAQMWAKYGQAIAGAVAPDDATVRSDFQGALVGPLS
jgi:hypothetical protein